MFAWCGNRCLHMHLYDTYIIGVVIGQFACQHLIEQDAKRIDIGLRSNNPARLFGGHIMRRAGDLIERYRFAHFAGIIQITAQAMRRRTGDAH